MISSDMYFPRSTAFSLFLMSKPYISLLSHLLPVHSFSAPWKHQKKFFWCFQGMKKGWIGNKWANKRNIHCTKSEEILNGKLHFLCSDKVSFTHFIPLVFFYTSWQHQKTGITQLAQCSISIPLEHVRKPKVFWRFQGV